MGIIGGALVKCGRWDMRGEGWRRIKRGGGNMKEDRGIQKWRMESGGWDRKWKGEENQTERREQEDETHTLFPMYPINTFTPQL